MNSRGRQPTEGSQIPSSRGAAQPSCGAAARKGDAAPRLQGCAGPATVGSRPRLFTSRRSAAGSRRCLHSVSTAWLRLRARFKHPNTCIDTKREDFRSEREEFPSGIQEFPSSREVLPSGIQEFHSSRDVFPSGIQEFHSPGEVFPSGIQEFRSSREVFPSGGREFHSSREVCRFWGKVDSLRGIAFSRAGADPRFSEKIICQSVGGEDFSGAVPVPSPQPLLRI